LLPYLTANLQFRIDQHDDVLLVSNAALRYRPAPDRVAPAYQDEYAASRQKRTAVSEMKPGKLRADNIGLVWIEDQGWLRPLRVRLGLTDGTLTEVLSVIDDDLEIGDRIVTGEVQGRASSESNPFAVQMWGKKKD